MKRPVVEYRSLTRRRDLEDLVQDAFAVVRAEAVEDAATAAIAHACALVPPNRRNAVLLGNYARLDGLLRAVCREDGFSAVINHVTKEMRVIAAEMHEDGFDLEGWVG